uniref:Uncharacterized protein n=1 Tax=Steinernema glaseri TaxID=37863 RepID=A0A1I8A9Z6_9BILA
MFPNQLSSINLVNGDNWDNRITDAGHRSEGKTPKEAETSGIARIAQLMKRLRTNCTLPVSRSERLDSVESTESSRAIQLRDRRESFAVGNLMTHLNVTL